MITPENLLDYKAKFNLKYLYAGDTIYTDITGMKLHNVRGPARIGKNGYNLWAVNGKIVGTSRKCFTSKDFEDWKLRHNLDTVGSIITSSDDPAFDDYSTDRGLKLMYYDKDTPTGADALEGHQSYNTDLRLPDTEKQDKENESMDWTGRENMIPAFGV
jgi:hypothetical protein